MKVSENVWYKIIQTIYVLLTLLNLYNSLLPKQVIVKPVGTVC